MPLSCAAYGCTNRMTRNGPKSFHRFPFSNNELLKQWIIAVRRKNFYPTRSSYICSDHFPPDSYRSTKEKRYLKRDVVPSIFNFSSHSQRSKKKTQSPVISDDEDEACSSMKLAFKNDHQLETKFSYHHASLQPTTSEDCKPFIIMAGQELESHNTGDHEDKVTVAPENNCQSEIKFLYHHAILQPATSEDCKPIIIMKDQEVESKKICGSNSVNLVSSNISDESADCSDVGEIKYSASEFQTSTPGFCSERISSTEEENISPSSPIILNLANCSTAMLPNCLPNESPTTIFNTSTRSRTASAGSSVNNECLKKGRSKKELRRTIRILQGRLRRREQRIASLKSALRQVVEIRKSGLN